MQLSVQKTIKAATVAVALFHPNQPGRRNRPFTIVGSGFCIDSGGIIVTCEHVLRTFADQEAYRKVLGETDSTVRHEITGAIPHVIFYANQLNGPHLIAYPVPVETAVAKTDFDLAVLKIPRHSAFPLGYPTLSIARYEDIHETMEIGTCGFPLGERLEEQLGTVTSSFTRGMVSSIIPTAGVPQGVCRGFQLDLTATNGNSGGPVYINETGAVFGVLAAGVVHPQTQHAVQGLTKAEPVYPLFANDLVARLIRGERAP